MKSFYYVLIFLPGFFYEFSKEDIAMIFLRLNSKSYKIKEHRLLKGVAKYTIKKSVLKKLKVGKKVTYQATYLKTTVKKTAKVKR